MSHVICTCYRTCTRSQKSSSLYVSCYLYVLQDVYTESEKQISVCLMFLYVLQDVYMSQRSRSLYVSCYLYSVCVTGRVHGVSLCMSHGICTCYTESEKQISVCLMLLVCVTGCVHGVREADLCMSHVFVCFTGRVYESEKQISVFLMLLVCVTGCVHGVRESDLCMSHVICMCYKTCTRSQRSRSLYVPCYLYVLQDVYTESESGSLYVSCYLYVLQDVYTESEKQISVQCERLVEDVRQAVELEKERVVCELGGLRDALGDRTRSFLLDMDHCERRLAAVSQSCQQMVHSRAARQVLEAAPQVSPMLAQLKRYKRE